MRTHTRHAYQFLAAGCAALLLLTSLVTACSKSEADTAPLEVDVQLTSQERVLHQAGASNEVVYGWNRLTGKTEIEGSETDVEMLGNVDYLQGNGDFFGFVTLTFADGSTLGLRMENGHARAATDTTDATFSSDLKVVGGTGKYSEVSGSGKFSGARKDALGGAVDSVFELQLKVP
jgi:hypothetical protein